MKKFMNENFKNFFLFPFILFLLCDLFFKLNNINAYTNIAFVDVFLSIFYNFKPFLISLMIIISLNALLIFITNNPKLSKIILSSIFTILLIVDDFKLVIMRIPVYLSDVSFLNPAGGGMITTFFFHTLGIWVFRIFFKGIIMFAIMYIFIYKDKKLKIKNRIVGIIVSLLLIVLPFNLKDFMVEKIYDENYDEIILSNNIVNKYYELGFFQGLFYSEFIENYNKIDYNQEEVVSKLNEFNDITTGDIKPNVVYVLSESLSDLETIVGDQIEFDKELLTYNNKQSFDMLVTSFGGSSVNTEFQILTGASINFYPSTYLAYTQLYTNSSTAKYPNLIHEFKKNGYTTEYITPWSKESYNSSYVYDLFGTDKKIYGSDLTDSYNKGMFVADSYMMDKIVSELSDGPKFLMVATGQNHMPCDKNRYNNYDINVTRTTFSEEDTDLLRCYAQGVYDANKELNRLYEEINKLDYPTIVVLYGDHLPYIINTKGEDVLAKTNYLQNDKYLNKKYTTPVFIISNYDIELPEVDYMNASYLGAYLVNNIGLDISNYFKYIYSISKEIPIFNRNYMLINNEFQPINNNEIYNLYKKVQHYEFN